MSDDRQIPTPAPADRPSFKILSGGAAINPEYQVMAVIVSRAVNRVAAAEILIYDGDPATEDFRVSNAAAFVPGNEIEIQAGYHGDEETVFKGLVVRHGVRVYNDKPALLRIECRDAAVKLTVGRRSAYFYESTDADIIEEIAGGAGLATDVESTGVSHPAMVQFYATDWDFVVSRAEANGRIVVTRDGTLAVTAPKLEGEPALSLRYGGNILEFEAFMDARDQFSAVQSSSWDAAGQQLVALDGAGPAAAAPGNIDSDALAAVIGLDPLPLKHAGQIGQDELQAWADGQRLKSAFAKVRGRVRIQGIATIAPGDVVALGGLGERFNGKALVGGVRHEIDGKNWETDLTIGLSPDWFGRTADDVVEPPANGLVPGVSGLQIGLVTALEGDPDGEDRIQVRIPLIDPSEEGVWARIATLDAGADRGTVFRPDIGDELALGFLNSDPRNPVILGQMHSSAKPAPIRASDDNHEKGIVTRSKIKLMFDDDNIVATITTPNGNTVVLSDADGAVSLTDEHDNKLVLDAGGITIDSAADVTIKAKGDVNIEGSNIASAAKSRLTAEGSAGAELSSGASTVVKGSVVQIN